MTNNHLPAYLQALRITGHDHANQQALKKLLENVLSGLQIDHDPRRAEIGAPDFIIWQGATPIGYLITVAFGGGLQTAESLRPALPNLLITNYLEFRWYTDGEPRQTAHAGALVNGHIQPERSGSTYMLGLLNNFARYAPPVITTPPPLAASLGTIAHEFKRLLLRAISADPPDRDLSAQMMAFRRCLLPDLTPEQFADMYVQALTCALFSARVRHKGAARRQRFNRRDIYWNLPPTNPFMRAFIQAMSETPLDERLSWMIDALAALLAHTDTDAVLRAFSHRSRREDTIAHFYDDFLRHYNPAAARRRGAHYTPEPVASYIVSSVDHILRKRFHYMLGLADENVLLIDPAAGSGTFFYLVIQSIYNTIRQHEQLGAWDIYVRDHLLPRLVGYELRLSPFAITHMKLSIELERLGYRFGSSQRLRVYLTNTLHPAQESAAAEGFAHLLAAESSASIRSDDYPIAVVIGSLPHTNTPANQHTGNPALDDLPDDYARFLQWARQAVDQKSGGILAVISNNAWLTQPDYRALRYDLLRTFTHSYHLNLNGEQGAAPPDETPDESIFDDGEGLVISIFIKRRTAENRIHYADLWGSPADKSAWLAEHDLADTEWQTLTPIAPDYLLTPQVAEVDIQVEYESGWRVADIFPVQAASIAPPPEHIRYTLAGAEQLATAHPLLYRPFDKRFMIAVENADAHMTQDGDNLALCLTPHQPGDSDTGQVLCSDAPVHHDFITGESAALFPLYLYPQPNEPVIDSPFPPGRNGRRPNLSHKFILTWADHLHMTFIPQGRGDLKYTFGPEDVFDYVYAILHSSGYRSRYAGLLRDDFARLPLTASKKRLRALAKQGRRLVNLHLLRGADSWPLISGFTGDGRGDVAAGHPLFIQLAGEQGGRVYINDTQYFTGIERKVWKYQAGGYQVLHEWLAQREGRVLDWVDLRRYQQVVVIVHETLQRIEAIDELIGSWPLR